MALNNKQVRTRLEEKFPGVLSAWEEPWGLLSFSAPSGLNLRVLQFLYDEQDLAFRFLTDLTGVHYPERKGEELAVVYHLHNLQERIRVRMKIFVPVEKPEVFTASQLFSGANWMERETFDFFGIRFLGHPNLIRILNVEEMTYFPLRKEYPLEDASRTDKDDEMFGRGAPII